MSIAVTLIGNLAKDPELRFTPSGEAVANFTVAVSKRVRDAAGTWTEGPPSYVRCSIWRQQAEHLVESLTKGNRVIVVGEMRQRDYEDRSGEKRSVWECEAQEVSASLRFATVKATRATKNAPQQAQNDDPWASNQGAEAPF